MKLNAAIFQKRCVVGLDRNGLTPVASGWLLVAECVQTGGIAKLGHIDGRSVSQGDDPADLPAAHDSRDQSRTRQRFALAKRQLIHKGSDEPPADIELRQAPFLAEIVAVGWPKRVAAIGADRTAIVDRLGPGEADQVGQALRQPLRQFCAEGMVTGIVIAIHFLKTSIGGPRSALRDRSRVGWPGLDDGLIVEAEALQFVALVAQIADFKDQISRQLALNVSHPLVDIRRASGLDVSQHLRRHQTGSGPSGTTGTGALKRPWIAKIGRPLFVAGDEDVATSLIAGHIEGRVGCVLYVEDADSRSNRPAPGRAIGEAQARREIIIVRVDQAPAHVLIAGLSGLSIGKVEVQALVKVTAARAGEDGRLRVGDDSVIIDARTEELDVHDAAILVIPGSRVFVAQSQVQGQLGRDPPIVLHVYEVGAAPEQRVGHRDAAGGLGGQTQHKVGESETGRVAVSRIKGGLAIKKKFAGDF